MHVTSFQNHLVRALSDRIQATEAAIGARFGFEIFQRDTTTVILAHQWPTAREKPALDRVFNYVAPAGANTDPIVERLIDERLDAIVEVLPGDHCDHTEQILRHYQFQPVWVVPWFVLDLQSFDPAPVDASIVNIARPHELAELADILVAGYDYTGDEAAAWHAFARYGYRASAFVPFLARVDQELAAAGILHLYQSTALVDGAATLPSYRSRGMQKALLRARLVYAKQHGAQYAYSRTGLGSISQANLEQLGMQLLTQSTAWRRI